MHQILNFYHFESLADLSDFSSWQNSLGQKYELLGTVLLAPEGINVQLSGTKRHLEAYFDETQTRLSPIDPKRIFYSTGVTRPFTRFKVKTKDYIVVFDPDFAVDTSKINDFEHIGVDQWDKLMNQKDVVVLDTRNYYEIDYGKFKGAEDLDLRHFRQFPKKFLERYKNQKDKTFLIYCTGGVRCEKAAVFMNDAGFSNVYQLDGGILRYIEEKSQAPESNWQGSCFVFDHRWAVDGKMQESKDGPHPDQLDRIPEIAGL